MKYLDIDADDIARMDKADKESLLYRRSQAGARMHGRGDPQKEAERQRAKRQRRKEREATKP
jgi:hypothetical protein